MFFRICFSSYTTYLTLISFYFTTSKSEHHLNILLRDLRKHTKDQVRKMVEELKIKINFNSPNKSYYPGQSVSGTIEFQLEQQQNFASILVQYIGEAKVQWEEKYDSCSDREEYFNFTQPLVGGNGTNARVLHPGSHKYPFEYQIPFSSPSTFKGSKGKVWYRVIAHAEVAGQNIMSFEEEFTVIAMLDLNGDPEINRPINLEFEEVYSCCSWDSSPINIRVSLPTSGYCPGQTMPIQVAVENNSNVEVQKMLFMLICRESYCARQPNRTNCTEPEEVLVKVKKGPVLTKTQKEFTVDLTVPDMIVPNLDNCCIIELNYFLKVLIKVTGCNDDDEDESEVALGSIPLTGTQNYEHPLKYQLPQGPMPIPPHVSTHHFTAVDNQACTYQGNMIPYPQASYPTVQAPYPTVQTSYPTVQTPYPTVQVTSPTAAAPYPTVQAPYATGQAPYPTVQAPYPTVQGPYPGMPQNSYNAAQPQINWQWNANAGPQVGYTAGPTSPSAPPQ